MIKTKTSMLALVTLATVALSTGANAATNGNLVLAFQNPGGTTGATSTLLLDLGSPATLRDATGFVNLGTFSNISANFGSTWYDATTLNVSAVSTWRESTTSTALLNRDPSLTLYVSRARTSAGTAGSASSASLVSSQTGVSTAGSNISQTIKTNSSTYFAGSSVVGNTSVAASGTGGQYLVNYNPTSGQLTAYNAFDGSLQQAFTSGSLFNFGTVGNVEAALDIYRVQFNNNIATQYGFGADLYTGQFIGTITLAKNAGDSSLTDIGFTAAVPEPSTYGLLGIAAAVLGFAAARRRNAAA
ncbi:MAG: PEP-CTERM sorting domain-containing protein [Verrucomicrobia bacterium]|nr:PEP-CTERM sorting domain-containing protein [Verrucomicrobiota bacterium]